MLKNRKMWLSAIILAAIVVRIAGIDFGLPFRCHNDEPVIVNYALAYGKGDFNPHFFKVPPLLSYLLFFLYGIFFLAGKISGLFASVSDFGYRFLTDPTYFYLIGRLFTGLFFGTMSVWLIYLLAKKLFNNTAGSISALFLAFNFLHARNSHYIYFDIPLVFFILLFFLRLLRLFERDRIKDYAICGLVLGIAISMKYSAVFMVLPAIIAVIRNKLHFRNTFPGFIYKNITAFLMVITAMFITNPFMFLDWKFFTDTLSRMPFFRPEFLYHIKVSLIGSCGLGMCIAALFGMFYSIKKRNSFAGIVIFFMVFYYLILTRSSQMAERYIFPILPFILIFSAYAVSEFVRYIKNKKLKAVTGVCLCAILMYPSIIKIYYCDRLFMNEDTRETSYRWVMENIPPRSKIALDSTGSVFPALPQNRELIEESLESFDNPKFDSPEGALDYKTKLIRENPYYPEKTYDIYYLKRGPSKDRFLGTFPEIYPDIEDMKAKGIEYVIVSSLLVNGTGKVFMPEVEKNASLVKEFNPYKEGISKLRPEEASVVPAAAFAWKELKDRKKFGPIIRVYKLK